jgi:hypothetical protein
VLAERRRPAHGVRSIALDQGALTSSKTVPNSRPVVMVLSCPPAGPRLAAETPMSHDDNQSQSLQRDPDEWKTGNEPMTAAQRSYMETLCQETGEEFDPSLSKAEASKRIDELREKSPRLAEN